MKLLRRIRYWIRYRQIERELAEEIDQHRALSGDARQMGNITRAREDARAVWIWPWLQSVWQDLAYAIRGLRREPGFTVVALLALGVTIGLNTSLFTVFNSLMLQSWPVTEPSRVVRVFTRDTRPTNGVYGLTGMSIAEFRYLAARTKTMTGLVSLAWRNVRFGFEPFGKNSQAMLVAADHFRVMLADMHLGRGFLPEEDSGPGAVTVLSYPVWHDHFGADPAILGKQVKVNDVPFTVVGVAPRDFDITSGDRIDAWMPLQAMLLLRPGDPGVGERLVSPGACCEPVAGRLNDGVTREQARAELEVLSSQFRSSVPKAARATFVLTDATLMAGASEEEQSFQLFGLLFLGGTLIVMLACANVGNLLVARAAARQREIEVRRALGAGRSRVIRQLLTESLVLALGAAGVGVLVAFQVPMIVLTLMSDEVPPFRLTPDGTVLAYALGLGVFACLTFGLAPALHGTRPNPGRSRLKLRSWLLASQVALSVILLTGAGLMLEGVRQAAQRNPGFAVEDVAVTSFELPVAAMNEVRIRAFTRQLVNDLPSTSQAAPFALALEGPPGGRYTTSYRLPEETRDQLRQIYYDEVTPGYFALLRMPLVAGRDFEPGDVGRRVVIVNETVARRWEGAAVGKTMVSGGVPREIIGVVKDAYITDVDRFEPMFYQPLSGAQLPKVLVRSNAPGIREAIEGAAARIEPGARAQTRPLADNLNRRLAPTRGGAWVAGVLGAFALALATVGMFGVFAYAVQQRTKEIGIRMALGARPAQVIRLVLAGSSRAVIAGFAAGFLAAAAASRLLAGYLYGVSPLDPRTYLLVAIILAAAAIAASYLPSRRAAKIDPLAALRHE